MKQAKSKSVKSRAKKKSAPIARPKSLPPAVKKSVVKKTTAKKAIAENPGAAFYLYAISDGAASVSTVGCPGIDSNGQVRAIEVSGLACWVSVVDRQQFVVNLERHMENLEWLAAAGVNHQKTVERLAAQTTIVPARFGAVFTSEISLREDVRRRAPQLAETLQRLHGTEEWGVKIFFAPVAPPPSAQVTSGREYLAQKAKAMNAVRSKTLPVEEMDQFLEGLQKACVTWAPGKNAQQNMIWSGSFLLKKGTREKFDQVLRSFAKRWQNTHQIECTGPWPPYSFV